MSPGPSGYPDQEDGRPLPPGPRLCAVGTTVVPIARTTTTGFSSTSAPEGLWSYREAMTLRASSSTVRLVLPIRVTVPVTSRKSPV